MHDEPRQILRQLIVLYGADLHANPRRTEALLRDYCADYPRELFVLIHSQRQRIPHDLLAAPAWLPQANLQNQLSHRLQTNLAFTAEAANWAVQVWAQALRIEPNPPDRVWIWLQKHAATPEIGLNSHQFVRKMVAFQRRQFADFGVQWQEALSSQANWAIGWLRVHWLDWWQRLRAPTLVAATLLFASLLLMASRGQTLSTGLGAVTESASAVFSLPRSAWVMTGPLMVRTGPSLNAQPIYLLGAQQEVTIIAYSADGQWAQVTEPVVGWVANQFLGFRQEGVPTHDSPLTLTSGRIIAERINVRAGPGTEFAVVGNLVAEQEIVLVATALEHEWKEIVHPLHGWVSATLIEVNKD